MLTAVNDMMSPNECDGAWGKCGGSFVTYYAGKFQLKIEYTDWCLYSRYNSFCVINTDVKIRTLVIYPR